MGLTGRGLACVAGLCVFGWSRVVLPQTITARVEVFAAEVELGEIVEVEVVVDLTGREDKLGAYEARLGWNPGVLALVDVLDGSSAAFAPPQTQVGEGAVVFSAFNVRGESGAVSLLRVRLSPRGSPGEDGGLALGFAALSAAQTFADLLQDVEVQVSAVRMAGGADEPVRDPDRAIAAGLDLVEIDGGNRRIQVDIWVDFSDVPEKLGAYEARLSWDAQVLELADVQDGTTAQLASPQTHTGDGELAFSHFSIDGVGGKAGLICVVLRIAEGTSVDQSQLRLHFAALAAAGTFADLLPELQVLPLRDPPTAVVKDTWARVKVHAWR